MTKKYPHGWMTASSSLVLFDNLKPRPWLQFPISRPFVRECASACRAAPAYTRNTHSAAPAPRPAHDRM
eukprot:25009-Eustigmatos_ZCMA.PRE.1